MSRYAPPRAEIPPPRVLAPGAPSVLVLAPGAPVGLGWPLQRGRGPVTGRGPMIRKGRDRPARHASDTEEELPDESVPGDPVRLDPLRREESEESSHRSRSPGPRIASLHHIAHAHARGRTPAGRPPNACPFGCGYAITWYEEARCKKCEETRGKEHGHKCHKQAPVPSRSEERAPRGPRAPLRLVPRSELVLDDYVPRLCCWCEAAVADDDDFEKKHCKVCVQALSERRGLIAATHTTPDRQLY